MEPKKHNSKSHKIELLAPAGDFECLTAAINAGCDAVYLGLEDFNMRARAKNFKLSDLPKISKLCKENKKKTNKRIKLYLTLNTIIYDNEIEKLKKIISEAKKAKKDTRELMKRASSIPDEILSVESDMAKLEAKIKEIMYQIPNIITYCHILTSNSNYHFNQ